MKYLFIVLLAISFSAQALDRPKKGSREYREIKAEQRAAAHPKGSGIGTTRYNIRYDKDYEVYGYSRNCCDIYKD